MLNFGEPEQPTLEEVVPFLERIFSLNAPLEGDAARRSRRGRAAGELAEPRAPGLIEEYEAIGGSPLNAQARAQAEALEAELRRARPRRARATSACSSPSRPSRMRSRRARAAGVDGWSALPVYPLCGPSTTVAALAAAAPARCAALGLGRAACARSAAGTATRATSRCARDAIRDVARREHGVDLRRPAHAARLLGARHADQVPARKAAATSSTCRTSARRSRRALGVADYEIGYQNHTNRPIEWTQPDIDEVIDDDRRGHASSSMPCSFMHEQSETLAELDHELREEAEARGLGVLPRARSRTTTPRFIEVLADLVEARWRHDHRCGERALCRCVCRRAGPRAARTGCAARARSSCARTKPPRASLRARPASR